MILKFRKPILSKLFNPRTRKVFVFNKRRIKLIRQEAHALREINECDYLLECELITTDDAQQADEIDNLHRRQSAHAIYV